MSAIPTRFITTATFSIHQPRNIQEPAKSLSKRLNFLGQFSCRKYVSWDIRRRRRSKIKGFKFKSIRASTTDDEVPAFEQETFVDESTILEEGGIEATINNLSKWLISASLTGLYLWRHDAEALWAAFGTALNATLSITLKNILNQERPVSTLRSDPGMPSSHAQTIVCTLVFFIVSLVERFGVNTLTATLSCAFIILGSYFTWLRVSQRLHTVSQVVAGAIVGSVFSFLWFWLWNAFVLNLFVDFLLARIVISVVAIVYITGFVLYNYKGWLNDV